MSEEKKRGRGKPKRYEGEESERLSVLVRPRYKRMVEMLANSRQTTISEAMEYAIASASRQYLIDEQSTYDWVLTNEDNHFYESNIYVDAILKSDTDIEKNQNYMNDFLHEYNTKPKSLITPLDNFIYNVNLRFGSHMTLMRLPFMLWQVFDIEKLHRNIKEDWKAASDIHLIGKILAIIVVFFKNQILTFIDLASNQDVQKILVGTCLAEMNYYKKSVAEYLTFDYLNSDKFSEIISLNKIVKE